jgi:hypothetical protein
MLLSVMQFATYILLLISVSCRDERLKFMFFLKRLFLASLYIDTKLCISARRILIAVKLLIRQSRYFEKFLEVEHSLPRDTCFKFDPKLNQIDLIHTL